GVDVLDQPGAGRGAVGDPQLLADRRVRRHEEGGAVNVDHAGDLRDPAGQAGEREGAGGGAVGAAQLDVGGGGLGREVEDAVDGGEGREEAEKGGGATGVDVLDQRGAGRCAVGVPQFGAVQPVVGKEEGGAVHGGQVVRGGARGGGEVDVLD